MATAGQTSLATVRAAVRQRADLVTSQFITDAELNGWINSSYQELYDILVQKYGDDYFVAPAYTFTTDGIADQFALPDGSQSAPAVYKLLGVEVQIQTNVWSDIGRFNFAERNRGGISNQGAAAGRTNLRYKLNGGNVWLRSGATIPASGQTIRVWYVPRLSLLVNDTDTLDGVSGWEEYVVVDSIIKCRLKGEEDPQAEMVLKQALLQRIESAAENRDVASASTVSDVRGSMSGWDGFMPGGWD